MGSSFPHLVWQQVVGNPITRLRSGKLRYRPDSQGFRGTKPLARSVDQFRAGDVTLWGIVALATWAVAILGANISGIVPPGIYGALHASRLEGSTINQLRSQVASLEAETVRLQRDASQLQQRLSMGEDATGAVTRRVGALEVSVPRLIEETRRTAPAVDPMATGSIGPGKTLTFETEGGTVAVQQRPLAPGSDEIKLAVVPLADTMPRALAGNSVAPGIALGFPVTADTAESQWQEMLANVGTMLVGLSPVLADRDGVNGKMLVAGPLLDKASAIELCARMDKVGVPCEPADYAGQPLPLLN